MHANAASSLEEYAKPGAKVLDVGCGSGYLTAVRSATTKSADDRFSREWYNQAVR
jgi:protein-L-isoaspartate(D-aspartate) O-methyltransferase